MRKAAFVFGTVLSAILCSSPVYATPETDRALLAESVASLQDLNAMASFSRGDVQPINSWTPISKLTITYMPNWEGRIYRNPKGDVVIAFPGSETPFEFGQDLAAGLGRVPTSFFAALVLTLRSLETYPPNKILLTGYSKGGMEVEAVAALLGLKCVAFSSPGIPTDCLDIMRRDAAQSKSGMVGFATTVDPSKIIIVNKEKDPVSTSLLKEVTNNWKTLYHVGTEIIVPALPNKLNDQGFSNHSQPKGVLYNLSPENKAAVITFFSGQNGNALMQRLANELQTNQGAVAVEQIKAPEIQQPQKQTELGRWKQIEEKTVKEIRPVGGVWICDKADLKTRQEELKKIGTEFEYRDAYFFPKSQLVFARNFTCYSLYQGQKIVGTYNISDPEVGIASVIIKGRGTEVGERQMKFDGEYLYVRCRNGENKILLDDYIRFKRIHLFDNDEDPGQTPPTKSDPMQAVPVSEPY